MPNTIQQLIQQFTHISQISFTQNENNIILLHIHNQFAKTTISLYGAQVLSYIPHGQQDTLWMSKNTAYEYGKAIRGGIPLCFPWFGPHATDNTKPQHGFARLTIWQIKAINQLPNQHTHIQLILQQNDATLAIWPYQFIAVLSITVGKSLKVSLKITNTSAKAFTYSNALHSYFLISNIKKIAISGLAQTAYYNGFEKIKQIQTQPLLQFAQQEENRRYIHHTNSCTIIDSHLNRNITIEKCGSKVTVVWNPGSTIAATIKDIHPNGHTNFVCIEPTNAYNEVDLITLLPHQSHTIGTTLNVQQL
jgi:glucose-6-phosphate 1-epimerase